MKNVTAIATQGFLQAGRGLPMSQGQIDDKLLSQIGDLTGADPDVARQKFLHSFFGATVPQKQGLTDKDHHVIAKGAA
jgi:hypothetical protein